MNGLQTAGPQPNLEACRRVSDLGAWPPPEAGQVLDDENTAVIAQVTDLESGRRAANIRLPCLML